MDEFLIIKSKEDIEDLFLYIKRHIRNKKAVKYSQGKYNKIYIDKNELNDAMEAFADFIIRNYAFFLIKDYFNEEYSLLDIMDSSIKNFHNGSIVKNIKNDMEEFSNKYDEINIQGYLMFAFRKYEDMIYDAIRDTLELYLAEEEYNRILSVISMYVDESGSEIDLLHIIKDYNGKYLYYDGMLNNITHIIKDSINSELENDCTEDDELLSVLIKYKPENINLHLKSQNMNINFLFTLEAIFGGRIKVCTSGCSICNS